MRISALRDDNLATRASSDEERWHPPRRRWGRWLSLFAVLLVFGFAGGYRYWVSQARSRLDAPIAQLRRDGEPVVSQDLVRPDVAAEDNAAFDLRAAAALLDTRTPAWKAFQSVSFDEPLGEEAKRAVAEVLKAAAKR